MSMNQFTPAKRPRPSRFQRLKWRITEIFLILMQLFLIALLAAVPFGMLYLFVKVIRIAWGP